MEYLQLGSLRFGYITNAQGCYISTITPNTNGYIQYYKHGTKHYLHRLVYAEHNLFLKRRRLTHTCGNRNCINITHIVEIRKCDTKSGSNNPNAKINEDIARSIYLAEGTQAQIAEQFNTNVRLVGKIKRRESWTNATNGL